jgi:hypothetical protein
MALSRINFRALLLIENNYEKFYILIIIFNVDSQKLINRTCYFFINPLTDKVNMIQKQHLQLLSSPHY